MWILTDRKLRKMIEDAAKEAKEEAYQKGYSDGLHKGLTSDRKGIHLNNNGMYMFDHQNEVGDTKNDC